MVQPELKRTKVMRNHAGWVSALGEAEGGVGDRPGGCGPEGAGAISQAPSFLGTKGDTLEQAWQNESLQGLGGAALVTDRGLCRRLGCFTKKGVKC